MGRATIVDFFDISSAAHRARTAVVVGDASITYGELDARANHLAHRLRSLGVGPDAPVGVCLGRSVDLAVALLGVLKAGGACVPLDPAYPPDRLAFMVGDAGVVAVVTNGTFAARVPPACVPVLHVDDGVAATTPGRSLRPDDVAYVIYTSGSTGTPRGVLLTHRGLGNHTAATRDLYELAPGDRVLQFCSLGFDASIEEMFPTWSAGATVVFRPDDVPLLGRGWLAWLRDHRINVVNLPTAYWHAWTRDLETMGETVPADIRLVVVGGEKARVAAYRKWMCVSGGRPRWINAYGPTETTCMSTYYEASGEDLDRDPPIGRPLPNTTVAVVDDGLRPVSPGVTGELLIGGAGLARGYLNHPVLTAERFVAGPGDERMYRTGDLVRRLDSGDLDYVGRIDDQVKVRGFRVEPGEVEAVLGRHPAVAAVAVVGRDDALVAYVAGTAEPGELRRFMAERVPAHLVPTAFVEIDALPLTPNGKVDRAALPDPPAAASGGAPRSPAEARMAAIWARVLGLDVDSIGAGDDFFDLGGHSLLATQVVAQVREEFRTDTPLRAIFEAPTLAALTAAVESAVATPGAGPRLAPRQRQPGARIPLSLAQEQMYGLEVAATPPGLQNITALHRFAGPVDADALRRAVACVVDRHEILRAGVAVDAGGQPFQFASPALDIDVLVTDTAADEEQERRIAAQNAAPFDLDRPPLFRGRLYPVTDGTTRFAVTVDHLVADGTGAAIFMKEVLAAYHATVTGGGAPALPPLAVQFADFALWQRAHVTDAVLDRQLQWWLEFLAGMPLGPAVPFDHVPTAPTRRIASTTVTAGEEVHAGLDAIARATGSTVFTVGVAAVSALLGRHGGTTDVVMSTTLSGRNRVELEPLIGMFSGIGRLRTDVSGDPSFAEIVARARDRVLGMFENQDIPFMRVRRALVPDFPSGGVELAAAVPVEFQFFHVDEEQELFFRGQLHPLSITLRDDGRRLAGELRYKLDFYEPSTVGRLARGLERLLAAVAADPSRRLSELPVD